MVKLAKREEQIMQIFWELKKAFIKELIPEFSDPKPHYNTVATMVKILEDKGFLAHEIVGNIYQYYPVISREDYQEHAITDIVKQYFNNSYPSMLAYFAKEEKISESELKQIIKLIKSNNK